MKDPDEILGRIVKLSIRHVQSGHEMLLWVLVQPVLKAKELVKGLVFTGHADP